MANMFDYLDWRGDLTVDAVPLGPVDFAVLAALIYCPFESIPGGDFCGASLAELTDRMPGDMPGLKAGGDWRANLVKLWCALPRYARFRHMTVEKFVYRFEDNAVDELDTQFCAGTFSFADGTRVVAFRGTDSTMVGWREDFNLGYQACVPAQVAAVDYLRDALDTSRPQNGRLYVCGHSKGGNLALFAASQMAKTGAMTGMTSAEAARIAGVYNFDGPGLTDSQLAGPGWATVADRCFTFVPESSIIGMLFGRGVARQTVQSDSASIMQHNMFMWHVLGGRFVAAEERTTSSDFFAAALGEFLSDTSDEERKAAVGALFKLVEAGGATCTGDLAKALMKNLPAVYAAGSKYTEEEKNALKHLSGTLVKNGVDALESVGSAALQNIAGAVGR